MGRVYLLSVNNYSFPGGENEDGAASRSTPATASTSWPKPRRNSTAGRRATTRARRYAPGEATHKARIDVAAERLRLLYVGMAQARQELIVLYNTGRNAERNCLTPPRSKRWPRI